MRRKQASTIENHSRKGHAMSSDRQKYYANLKRKDIDFQINDKVFLKVSPWKKILRFGRKGKNKASIERIGPMAYRLALLLELQNIHNVFHVSMLRQYRSDPSHVISLEDVEIQPDMTFNEEHIKILDQEVKLLRNKSIDFMKVLWQRYGVEDATWEPEKL